MALAAALALCLVGTVHADGLTQAERQDLRTELVATNSAQPSPGAFSVEELADLRNEVRAMAHRTDFGLSAVPIRQFTETELADLRHLAHRHRLSAAGY